MPAKKPYRKTDRWANEKQFAAEVGSGLNDVIGRGTLAGLLGLPGDLGNALWSAGVWANNKIKDVEYATGMLKPDMASLVTGKRKGYLAYPQGNAYGGSEHIGQKMQDYGLVSPVRRPKTELLAGLLSPAQVATASLKAPQYAKTALKLLDNLDSAPTMARIGQRGAIDVWHGSPHKFEQFKAMDNIGGGEGAQAYGHGGYHAGNKDVANGYKQALSPEYRSVISYAGPDRERQAASLLGSNIPEKDVLDLLADLGDESPDLTLERGRKILAQAEESGNLYRNQLRWPNPAREAADPLSDKHFLDWDKPLSEQSPEVRQVINGLGERYQISDGQATKFQNFPESFTGRDLYKRLGISERYNSKELADIGIPGIRYLDGGSRSAGQGSYNYVTFDDALVNILERNGQPVTAPQPGLLGKMVAPQDEALRVAQQNAAKPVSEGGLGLRPDNTPEERAAAMGYTTDAYHGTGANSIESFDNRLAQKGLSKHSGGVPWFSSSPEVAGEFAGHQTGNSVGGVRLGNSTIYPVKLRMDGADIDEYGKYAKHGGISANEAKELGIDAIKWPESSFDLPDTTMMDGYPTGYYRDSSGRVFGNDIPYPDQYGLPDTTRIRSRFAAFDPMRRDSSDLLAGLSPLFLARPQEKEKKRK